MTKTRWHVWLIVLVWLMLSVPVFAQSSMSDVRLATFTNTNFNIQGMRPNGWVEVVPNSGVFRPDRNSLERTALLVQSTTASSSQLLNNLREQYQQSNAPTLRDTLITSSFTWSIYKLESDIGSHTLHIDIALAEQDGMVYMVLMQTTEVFYSQIHQPVFIAVVNSIAPLSPITTAEAVISARQAETRAVAEWTVIERAGFSAWQNTDATILVYLSTVESDDGEAAIHDVVSQILPDENLAYDNTNVTRIESGTSFIIIIDYPNAEGILRGMAQVRDGITQISILDTTVEAIQQYQKDLEILTGDVMLEGLLSDEVLSTSETTPEISSEVEATAEASEDADN